MILSNVLKLVFLLMVCVGLYVNLAETVLLLIVLLLIYGVVRFLI